MHPSKFREDWTHSFPGTLPVTFLFRSELLSRWFRVHSLPGSKRYAEDALDWQILLTRHNDILDDLFERGEDLYLVATSYEHNDNGYSVSLFKKKKTAAIFRWAAGTFLCGILLDVFRTFFFSPLPPHCSFHFHNF
jgi:hypothetical protein